MRKKLVTSNETRSIHVKYQASRDSKRKPRFPVPYKRFPPSLDVTEDKRRPGDSSWQRQTDQSRY